MCCIFYNSHPDRCELVSQCGFDLHLLIIGDVKLFFRCLLVICMSSLENFLFGSSDNVLNRLFVFWMLGCMGSLYILDINPLSSLLFANIFSHLAGCFSFCWQLPLLCKSLLVWHNPICFFCFPRLRRQIRKKKKKKQLKSLSMSILLVFSSRIFMFSSLTFTFLFHFEFIFIYVMRKQSSLTLLHVAAQFSQHYLLKSLSFHSNSS